MSAAKLTFVLTMHGVRSDCTHLVAASQTFESQKTDKTVAELVRSKSDRSLAHLMEGLANAVTAQLEQPCESCALIQATNPQLRPN